MRIARVAHTTVRRYPDLLTSVFVVRQLQPWFENISKRQVRSPKVYIADSGILHALLGLDGARRHGFEIKRSEAVPAAGLAEMLLPHASPRE